jgi:putative ABC transport system permease protein
MPLREALFLAIEAIRTSKLRSFFTLLGIIVSVGFLVAVVAIIQGMNSYVRDNLRGAMIGTNSFQVRRSPIAMGNLDDSTVREINKRPIVSQEDAGVVRRALVDAEAVSLQSGWPTPFADISYRNRTVGSVLIFGVTPDYQVVQDYRIAYGDPLTDPDVADRRLVAVVGPEVADKLFDNPELAIGKKIRIGGTEITIKGVTAKKGRVLGQSFDGFALLPLSTFEAIYGRRLTTTVSVKMPDA